MPVYLKIRKMATSRGRRRCFAASTSASMVSGPGTCGDVSQWRRSRCSCSTYARSPTSLWMDLWISGEYLWTRRRSSALAERARLVYLVGLPEVHDVPAVDRKGRRDAGREWAATRCDDQAARRDQRAPVHLPPPSLSSPVRRERCPQRAKRDTQR